MSGSPARGSIDEPEAGGGGFEEGDRLRVCLLLILAEGAGPVEDLVARLPGISPQVTAPGAVSQELAALVRGGFVRRSATHSGGEPAGDGYELTPTGRAELARLMIGVTEALRAIDRLFGTI